MTKNYLENIICKFRPLFEIDYRKKQNIVSSVFFKMYGGGYKSFQKYLDGIVILAKYIATNMKTFRLRLFIDESIVEDPNIMKLLTNQDLDLVVYGCPDYIIEEKFHKGTFGTLVRFFPLFDFKNNDTNYVISYDIDIVDWTDLVNLDKSYNMFKLMESEGSISKSDIVVDGNMFHAKDSTQTIIYKNHLVSYILAQRFLSKRKIDHNVIVNYLKSVESLEILPTDYMKIIRQPKGYTKFVFGVDEYFLNHTLVDHLIKTKSPFCYKIKYQITYDIFWKTQDNFLNKEQIKVYEKFFKYVFQDDPKFKFVNCKQAMKYLDSKTYLERTLKSSDETLEIEGIFVKMYEFFIQVYNNRLVKYFNKDFLDVILNDIFLSRPFFLGLIFYNAQVTSGANIIFKDFKISNINISDLKRMKKEYSIRNTKLNLINRFRYSDNIFD